MIYKLGDHLPRTSESCFIADTAIIIGRVLLGENCSVWYYAVVRGDDDEITIGNGTNIQDGAVLHCDDGYPLSIGNDVTIGHKAMLHGCSVGDNSLIGINAVVLNGARIGKNCLVGANALIRENMIVPDGSLVLGSPGKIVRPLTLEQQAGLLISSQHYQAKIALYKNQLSKV